MDLFIPPIDNLLQTIIQETHTENQQRNQEKMAQIKLITDAKLRDSYIQQLLVDKFLIPIEQVQHEIQKAATHAQYMAEAVNYHYKDHHLTKEQGKEVSQQFRILAVQLSQVDSLYSLKITYKAVTIFAHCMANFQHKEKKYSIEREIRKHILERLGTCLERENNFQRQSLFINQVQN